MGRYFMEIAYKGTRYAGFQKQKNALTVQQVIEDALSVLLKQPVPIMGSSRTDTGVHARKNVVHFDAADSLPEHLHYQLNAVLPHDIAVHTIYKVREKAHARFSALSRKYEYVIYFQKNPFLKDFGYYFPYPLDMDALQACANLIPAYKDFRSFSKKRTQVKTFICHIQEARWEKQEDRLIFHIRANRFLRGMVRGLVATQLKVGRGKITIDDFRHIIESQDHRLASFAVPPDGLYLCEVQYGEDIFPT
ncbi:tRNA pseudouridine(38-40) synthase TruA [Thermoflavifilum aggregans]|nr:tRNA pseudouridine(38-40) synthase TruA [Thermoflavifilum aggregans]MBX6380923.1 tRNA pseudouridine(38-40) synthase TruA [Thermoflavifilum aggregans]